MEPETQNSTSSTTITPTPSTSTNPTPLSPPASTTTATDQPVEQPSSSPLSTQEPIAKSNGPDLTPDPSIEAAKINVGNFAPPVETNDPKPTFKAPDSKDEEWKPSNPGLFASPLSVFVISLLGLVTGIIFLTFGVSVNLWIKLIVMLILSGASVFFAVKAYSKNQNVYILVGLIVSVFLLMSTVVVGSTYTYYYFKFKALENSYRNYSSSSSDYSSY